MKPWIAGFLGLLLLMPVLAKAGSLSGYDMSQRQKDRNADAQIQERTTLYDSGPKTEQSGMQAMQGTMGGMQGLSNEEAAKVRRWQMNTMQSSQTK
ncbi:MAG: hypothetical protein KGQ58_08125 [Proteobacteria bacterium]|nr:hypothetical protein [Pseudomonadota bacterium]